MTRKCGWLLVFGLLACSSGSKSKDGMSGDADMQTPGMVQSGSGGSAAAMGTGGSKSTGSQTGMGSGGMHASAGTGGMSATGNHGSGGSGAAGDDGHPSPDAGDAPGPDAMVSGHRPPCITSPSQVGIFGDSYINWVSHTFPDDLTAAAGETWRMYAVGGYAMGSGGIGLIPPTFDDAIAEDPDIRAALMDGGGNDILVPDTDMWPDGADCKNREDSPTVKDCQGIVQTALDAAQKLMMHAADSGVKDVVYFFYPHVPDGTLVGGDHPNAMLDYSLPKVEQLCTGAEAMTDGRLRCHFVNTVPLFEGHPELFADADIHENPDGSKVIADAVWQKMKDECVGQHEDSGCCEP